MENKSNLPRNTRQISDTIMDACIFIFSMMITAVVMLFWINVVSETINPGLKQNL